MTIERANEVPGQPPTHIWTAIGFEDRRNIVLVVGMAAVVKDIAAGIRRPTSSMGPIRLPVVEAEAQHPLDKKRKIPLAIMMIGSWETNDRAKEVVDALSADVKTSVKGIRRLAQTDRKRLFKFHDCISDDTATGIAKMYLEEVRRAMRS